MQRYTQCWSSVLRSSALQAQGLISTHMLIFLWGLSTPENTFVSFCKTSLNQRACSLFLGWGSSEKNVILLPYLIYSGATYMVAWVPIKSRMSGMFWRVHSKRNFLSGTLGMLWQWIDAQTPLVHFSTIPVSKPAISKLFLNFFPAQVQNRKKMKIGMRQMWVQSLASPFLSFKDLPYLWFPNL